MKVKWRKHEIITITILVAIGVIGYLWDTYNIRTKQISTIYASTYDSNHIEFNYYYNVLLPKIGSLILLYLMYLWINLAITRSLVLGKNTILTYISVVTQLSIVSFLLALGINAASYLAHPHFFNYGGGGFQLLALSGYNDKPLTNVFSGFDRTSILVIGFALYTLLREYLSYKIESSSKEKPYLVLVINQATAFLIIYICIPAFSITFNLIRDDHIYRAYFAFITSTFLVYFSNIYWLFPSKGERRIASIWFLSRLLFSALIYCFPIVLFITHQNVFSMLWVSIWIIQLLMITPVSWMIYGQYKDQIKQLRTVQTALSKSNADLQFLKWQINPHFLFNALNTLYGITLTDGSKRGAEGVQKLGDMMRFMLEDTHLDFIPMHNEIAYLKNYISFQRLRMQCSNDLFIDDTIDEGNCAHLIAPMLLIPLVENAFKHGIEPNQKSWIQIKLNCDSKMIHFEVRNSVHVTEKKSSEKERSGIGIENVRERLQILYPGKHRLIYGFEGQEFITNLNVEPHLSNPE